MWYNKVVQDIGNIEPAIEYYQKEYLEARKEVALKGNLEKTAASLPGQIEYRFYQLQELEAILEHLNISLRKKKSQVLRKFMEHYNKELTLREAEKWTDADDDVVSLSELVNEIALMRNQFAGIMKGLENKQWQVTNIVKLRVAGLEDAEVGKF